MLSDILARAPLFLLVAARCLGLILTLPLFSMRTVPRVAKIALAGYMAYIVMGLADFAAYGTVLAADGAFTLYFLLLALGEAMIGVIIGFLVALVFAAFSTAGQFFAFQMGFSASEVYDSLAQVENPLMGQFFNFTAMLVFMQSHWFQKLFLKGLVSSLSSLNVFELIAAREKIVTFILASLSNLFADALVISLPIMGTLMLITVCIGLLSKAAPQMNLLSEGFPVMILLSFMIIFTVFPALIDFFVRSFTSGLNGIAALLLTADGGGAQ